MLFLKKYLNLVSMYLTREIIIRALEIEPSLDRSQSHKKYSRGREYQIRNVDQFLKGHAVELFGFQLNNIPDFDDRHLTRNIKALMVSGEDKICLLKKAGDKRGRSSLNSSSRF